MNDRLKEKDYMVRIVTDCRTFMQATKAYHEDEAIVKVRAWTFPHETFKSANIEFVQDENGIRI